MMADTEVGAAVKDQVGDRVPRTGSAAGPTARGDSAQLRQQKRVDLTGLVQSRYERDEHSTYSSSRDSTLRVPSTS
jgi:hypothetical protein